MFGALSRLDQADPAGLRRGDPALPSPGAGGRARGDGRPSVRRPGGVRHRPFGGLRADGHGDRSAQHARDVGRVPRDDSADLGRRAVLLGRSVLEGAAARGSSRSRFRSRTRPSGWLRCSRPPTSWRPRRASGSWRSAWPLPRTSPHISRRTRSGCARPGPWASSSTTSGSPPPWPSATGTTRPRASWRRSRSGPSSGPIVRI